jgi:hypothetical protein
VEGNSAFQQLFTAMSLVNIPHIDIRCKDRRNQENSYGSDYDFFRRVSWIASVMGKENMSVFQYISIVVTADFLGLDILDGSQ